MKSNGRLALISAVILLMALTFFWGISVGKYKIFPYSIIVALKDRIRPQNGYQATPSWHMPQWNMDLSQFEILPSQPDIIMLGDSITASGEWHELLPNVSVVNRGIAKETTAGLLRRTTEVVDRKPRAVFLLIGINDVGTGVSIESIYSNYTKLIETFESRGIRVFIQSTILPGRNIEESQRRAVVDLNSKLFLYAGTRKATSYLDLNQVLAPEGFLRDDYTLDGIHLNGAAYKRWSEHILEHVKSVSSIAE